MNPGDAARALHVHPNTLRRRLRRIAERTGRDPFVLADLFELTAAARVIAAAS
jgi:carbohydrate diacid regulator